MIVAEATRPQVETRTEAWDAIVERLGETALDPSTAELTAENYTQLGKSMLPDTRELVVSGTIAALSMLGRESREASAAPISDADRSLTEVDNLNRHRSPDGSHSAWAYKEVMKNQITAVMEAAIPQAVSKTYQEYALTGELDRHGRPVGTYMWLGKTAVRVAQSGYAFHRHAEARARVAVEVEEARHNDQTMREGYARMFISPKDENLKDEHLGNDDSLRVSYLDVSKNGDIKGKHLESILVKNVPLDAWTKMLADPNNIWGKSIHVADSNSPLSVMKTHRELEIPLDQLPEGVVSLLAAVTPYIADKEARASVERQLVLFRGDQKAIYDQASSVASRWMEFEVTLADSLHAQRATPEVERFINQLQTEWSDKDIVLFNAHRLTNGSLRMSRELAARLEQAKQNLLWTAAAVVAGNEAVLEQMDGKTALQIFNNETLLQQMLAAGMSAQAIMRIEALNNKAIAQQNIKVGSGCPGVNDGGFGDIEDNEREDPEDRATWKIKKGRCRIENCPNHAKIVDIGPCDVCMGRCQRIYDAGGDPLESNKSGFALAA
jgi:hypothetical protein